MKFSVKFFLFFSLFIFIPVVINADEESRVPEYQTGEVNVAQGDYFSITLNELPSAGMQWTISDLDKKYLALVGKANQEEQSYQKEESSFAPSRMLIGGSKIVKFEFQALKKGITQIVLTHGRSWEAKPYTVLTYTVTIE